MTRSLAYLRASQETVRPMHKTHRGIGGRIERLEQSKQRDEVLLYAIHTDRNDKPSDPLACYLALRRQVSPIVWRLVISEIEEAHAKPDLFAALIVASKEAQRQCQKCPPWVTFPLGPEEERRGYEYIGLLINALLTHGVQADLPSHELQLSALALKGPETFRRTYDSLLAGHW